MGDLPAGAQRAEVTVPRDLHGERLDRAAPALVEGLSRTRSRSVIAMGGVYIGSKRCHVASRKVRAGDCLTVVWHPRVVKPVVLPLDVILSDDDVVVVCKPAGQHVQGTPLGDAGTLVRDLEKSFGPSTRLMHRLDADASGLLVAARHRGASQKLDPQFRRHSIERAYLAACAGKPPEGPCTRDLVAADGRMRPAQDGESGSSAHTDIAIVGGTDTTSLVEARLHTGRTHQIRVHLMSLGSPILGDKLYGGPSRQRLCLHAWKIGFDHPTTGERMVFERLPDREYWSAAGVAAWNPST